MLRILVLCLSALFIASPSLHAQTTLPNIDDTDRLQWQNCGNTGCSGGKTNGTPGVANITESAPFNFTVDGQSLRFDLVSSSGCSPHCFSNALFWNELNGFGVPNSGTDSATRITMDMMVGLDSAGINGSQALEFTVQQTFCTSGPCPNGTYTRYTYSFQCDFAGGGWNVWNGATGHWVPIGAACVRFEATNPNGPSFNHFIFNFARTPVSQECPAGCMQYVDFFVNNTHVQVPQGVQIQQPHNLGNTRSHEFLASMQLDGNADGASYSAWVDSWGITYQ